MQLIIPVSIVLVLIFGCQEINSRSRYSITGTYVRCGSQEYGIEYDTLVVSVQVAAINQYQVVRKWKYQRILDGSLQDPEYKVTRRSAIYYEPEKSLRGQDAEVWYTFDSDNNLFNGPVQYHKL